MGEENHNLCCLFFQILPHLLFITPFNKHKFGYSSHHGAVDGASAWQAPGRAFEPVLMRYIFGQKYLGLV